MSFRSSAIIGLLFLLPFNSWGNVVPLDPSIGKYPLGLHFEYLEDPSGLLDIHAISQPPARNNFISSQTLTPNFGWTQSTYWLQFTPINTRSNIQKWLLEFDYSPLDIIEIWQVPALTNEPVLLSRGGDLTPYKQRPASHFKHSFPIVLKPNIQSIIYIKIKTESLMRLNATLWSEKNFERHQRWQLSKRGLFSGLLLGLAIYNFLIFVRIRDNSYAWFSVCLMAIFLNQSAHTGIISEWLWPNSITLTNLSPLFTSSISAVSFSLFFRSFLRSRERAPYIDRIFIAGAVYFIAISPIIFLDYTLAAKFITFAVVPLLVFDFYACCYIWFKGFKAARILLLAWTFYLLAGALYTLALLNFLPELLANYDYPAFGGAIGVILLAIALADRLQLIQTERNQLKAQLLLESEKSDQLKSTFLATISHELRTPIHGIRGCLEMIDTENISEITSSALLMAHQSTNNLERLIERLLIFSDTVAEKLQAEPEIYPLARELILLVHEYQALYNTTKIHLAPIADNCQLLTLDGKKFIMAIQQLLDNACRFSLTSQHRVTLKMELNDSLQADKNFQLSIHIKDTGTGIRKTELDRVIQAFKQKDQSLARRHGGLGVGLTLANSLAHILGGSLQINSIWGEGTEAILKIPILNTRSNNTKKIPDITCPTKAHPEQISVLVVEDNAINREVVCAMLRKQNCRVSYAENGEQALELYCDHKNYFDLIFMDCQMPIMDGLEASLKIREYEKTYDRDCHKECLDDCYQPSLKYTPIIAITANAMSGDREKCLQAGMTDYLSKPVKPQQLADIIKRNLAHKNYHSQQIEKS